MRWWLSQWPVYVAQVTRCPGIREAACKCAFQDCSPESRVDSEICWRELMTPQMQGSRVYEQSPQSDAAGLCWASQRNWFATAKPGDWPLPVRGWLKMGVSTTSRDVRNDVSDRSGTWILPRLTGFAVGSTDAISDVDRSRGVGHVVVWRSRSSHRTSTNLRLPEYPDS